MVLDPLTAALIAVEDNAELLRGPQGIQGVPGPAGRDSTVPGPRGLKGDPGKPGADGKDGKNGERGKQGERGLKGEPGKQGDPGKQGEPGLILGGGGGGPRILRDDVELDIGGVNFAGDGFAVTVANQVARVEALGGTGSGLPAGGNLGQVVTNTAPGTGDWQDPTGGGSPLTVTDGSTSVANVTQETLVGAVVSAGGAGEAIVTVGFVADPGNVWEADTPVRDGYRVASGTHVWQVRDPGTTGTVDATTHMNLTAAGFSTIVEPGGVSWTYVGEIGGYPVPPGLYAGVVGISDPATFAQLQQSAFVDGDGSASVATVADVSGSGNATRSSFAVVNGDGSAIVDDRSEVTGAVLGNAQGFFDSIAASRRAGWRTYADASEAHAGFDDGAGIGPNGAPATPGMALVADAGGYPRWTAGMPTADEKAALDNAPTALTALNPVASVADLPAAQTLSSLGAAPSTPDYLVGTASGDLSAEIVVGTTPGGELGGTWGSPTVDTTHSGSAHLALGATSSTAAPGDHDHWHGAWSAATAYSPGDMVTIDGASWVCRIANTALRPFPPDYREASLITAPGWYSRLGNASGTVVVDEMGANNGTYVNSPALGVAGLLTGDSDTAVLFAAASAQYITIPYAPALHPGDVLTLMAWYQRPAAGVIFPIFRNHPGGAILWFYSDNHIYLSKSGSGNVFSSTSAYTDTNKHQIAVTKNGATTVVYLDGSPISGSIANETLVDSGGGTTIGQYPGATASGTFDEPAIWGRALAPAEIAGLNAVGTGTVYWERYGTVGTPAPMAAFIDPATATAGDIATALIAAGLMAVA